MLITVAMLTNCKYRGLTIYGGIKTRAGDFTAKADSKGP
jgi:hypothetical protein